MISKRSAVVAALTITVAAATAALNSNVAAQANSGVFIARLSDASGKRIGNVYFLPASGGRIQVSAVIRAGSGLTPGKRGFHVHVNGACTDSTDASGATVKFGGAGGHFNPTSAAKHGGPDDHHDEAHAGDLPNLTINADGSGGVTYLTNKLSTAAGANSVRGRSVVVHAAEDDYRTQPIGGSGARVACGVIQNF
ncbi:MAG TPA: superoxide dismutase family protein [Deinococcales bacterium]|nr:superoxide dismutase family protein [Deinococcales bacterium]